VDTAEMSAFYGFLIAFGVAVVALVYLIRKAWKENG